MIDESLPQMLALLCASIVSYRVIMTLNQLSFKYRSSTYARWLAFGLSYAGFMIAALGSCVHIWQGLGTTGDWLWLVAAAGMVVFDRRHTRERVRPHTLQHD